MHQKIEDNYSWEETRPMWICRLEDDIVDLIQGGWSNEYYKNDAMAFLGMLEIDQILAPILRTACGPIHIFWPKGTHERLEVIIHANNLCHVTRKAAEFVKEEFECSPLGLREALLKFYPFVKSNFDRKFSWTGMI